MSNERTDTNTSKTPNNRVGIAIQGGVFPSGAFAAGVLKGLVEKEGPGLEKAFNKYDICAFSGTSSGALVATLCWGHRLKGTIDQIPKDLERQWMYSAWPRHLAWLPVWTPAWGVRLIELETFLTKFPLWRTFVEQIRTPFVRWVMMQWIEDTIPIHELNDKFQQTYTCRNVSRRHRRPGLVLGAADVLKGEIKVFREDELSLPALLSSGSLDEFNGMATIVTPPHAGTYLDGAWADNPPIGELMDYRLNEIWLIQTFPKAISELPHTLAERKERKEELWQNSLIEHELEFINLISHWHDALNKAIQDEILRLQSQNQLPGTSPNDPILQAYLQKLHDQNGKLPDELHRLFDESNDFEPKQYEEVKVKVIGARLPRELGSAVVNAPGFIRNMMHHGYERACDFVERDFGEKVEKPTSLRPSRWASMLMPSPVNDFLYHAYPSRSMSDFLKGDGICDYCPKKAMSTARELLPDFVLPKAMSEGLTEVDETICDVCRKTRNDCAMTLAA